MDVAGANVVTDANTIPDAETVQGVGETCGLDRLHAVTDGVVDEEELATEHAGSDRATRVSMPLGGNRGMVVGCGFGRS